jgi:pimeloyl-ACP methyl ester carboxylesterase
MSCSPVPGTGVERGRTRGGISYRAAGHGPPVVLLHGLGSTSLSWIAQLTGLADEYRMIAWDAPGYAESDDPEPGWSVDDYAERLQGFVVELALGHFHLVGHSMGGVVAIAYCRDRLRPVRSLFLSDTYGGGRSRAEPGEVERVERRLDEFRRLPREAFARRRVDNLLAPAAPPEVRKRAELAMAGLRSPAYEIANGALAAADIRPVLPTLRLPVTVVWGELDRVTPGAEGRCLADAVPEARTATIPAAGHLSNQEQPERYNDLLRSHLRAAQPAGTLLATGKGDPIGTG